MVRVPFPYVLSTCTISVDLKNAYDFRTFLGRERFPNVSSTRTIPDIFFEREQLPMVLSTRTISKRFKYTYDFKKFSPRTISVRIKNAYDFSKLKYAFDFRTF